MKTLYSYIKVDPPWFKHALMQKTSMQFRMSLRMSAMTMAGLSANMEEQEEEEENKRSVLHFF